MRFLGAVAPLALLLPSGCARTALESRPTLETPVALAPVSETARQPQVQLETQQLTKSLPRAVVIESDIEIPTIEPVQFVLYRSGCGSYGIVGELSANELKVLRWGARAFPAYQAILADPASDVFDVVGVCIAIHSVKVDRRQFVHLLIRRVTDPDALVHPGAYREGFEIDVRTAISCRNHVRRSAIELLGEIGSEAETKHIREFLWHEDAGVQYAVLSTLGGIGCKHDLDAVNAWLCNPQPLRPNEFIRRVQKCRDEIDARLKAAPTTPNYW